MRQLFIFTLFLSAFTARADQCLFQDHPSIQAAKSKCLERTDRKWTCETNTCEITAEASRIQKKFFECEKASADQKNACYDQVRSYVLSDQDIQIDSSVKDPALGVLGKGLLALQTFHIIMSYTVAKQRPKCTPMQLYTAATAVGIINEFGNQANLEKQTEELRQQYYSEDQSTDGANTQLRSFEFLAAQQDVIGDIAAKKVKSYRMTAVAYAGVSAMATISAFKQPDACALQGKIKKDPKPTPAASEEASYNPLFFWNAYADDGGYGAALSGLMLKGGAAFGAVNMLDNMLGKNSKDIVAQEQTKLTKLLYSSKSIAILSGVSSAVSFALAGHYRKVEKKARNNASEIRTTSQNFIKHNLNGCTSKDNPGNPACYCYNINGTRHFTRKNEPLCQAYFDSLTYSQTAYQNTCVNSQGVFDANCDCAQSNSCLRINASSLNNAGAAVGMTDLIGASNQITNGAGLDNIGEAGLMALSHNNPRKMNEGLAKLPGAKPLDRNNTSSLFEQAFPSDLRKPLLANIKKSGSMQKLAHAPAFAKVKAENVIAKAKAYAPAAPKKSAYKAFRSGPTTGHLKNKNQTAPGFDFKFNNYKNKKNDDSNKTQVYVEKKFTYRNEDVHINKETSLFKIISHRYITSGIKKLEGK